MAFKSNEGKTSGVCRDCDQLPNVHGVCGCNGPEALEEEARRNARTEEAHYDHPEHEDTSKDDCGICAGESILADRHKVGLHIALPNQYCSACVQEGRI